MEASRTDHAVDLDLARAVGEGVVEAWHEFVERYSGLVVSVVRRYLPDFDDEARRDTYVEILKYMYATGLARYDGRAALSTWVMAISRSRSLDARRAMCGRRREPTWLAGLRARDRQIFRLYFEDGESLEAIQVRLARRGKAVSAAEVVRSLDRLEARMDRRLRTRLAYDLYARSVGVASGSLLSFLDHLRLENAAAADALRPDLQLMERRMDRLLARVEQSVRELEPQERQVVDMHFYRHLTAPQIAAELGLPGPRRVYTLIGGAISSLRRLLARDAATPLERRKGAPGIEAEGTVDGTT